MNDRERNSPPSPEAPLGHDDGDYHHPRQPEGMDRVYFALRALAVIVGLLYAYISPAELVTDEIVIAFAAFLGYGTLFYVVGYRLAGQQYNRHFYAALGAADLLFVVWLMHLTGAEHSPFYRALYLWVAMPAFYFGRRTGSLASAVAFVVFFWFFSPATDGLWTFLVKCGGLLLHGPLIGHLVDRNREHIHGLERANRALQRVVDQMQQDGSPASSPVRAPGS